MNPFEVPRCPACGAEVTTWATGMQTCAACDHRWMRETPAVERVSSPVSAHDLGCRRSRWRWGWSRGSRTSPIPPFISSPIRRGWICRRSPVTPGLVLPVEVPVPPASPFSRPLRRWSQRPGLRRRTDAPATSPASTWLGWVENVSKIEISKPKVLAILRGGDDSEVGQAIGFAEADTLLPGGKEPHPDSGAGSSQTSSHHVRDRGSACGLQV